MFENISFINWFWLLVTFGVIGALIVYGALGFMGIYHCISPKEKKRPKLTVPTNLEECFKQLDKIWTDKDRELVMEMGENDYLAKFHHGPGQWIRNNWGLWIADSELYYYFTNMEINHPDDMSGIILTSYYRKLKGKDIELDKQIKKYQDYWKNAKNDGKIEITKIPGLLKKKKQ